MHKTEVIHARVTPDLKHSVQAVLRRVGLSTTDAVSLFFRQIVLNNGLPFEVRIPNKETRLAIKEARAGKNMKSYASVAEMRHALEGKPARKSKKKA
ncbi:MAG: type II toxin-antitoxin system RelB/DinJ family antitoxin [Alphaproteobacteria bacterium]|nr:type II toxin-antitoxin system RelB/DinJ family antitoxin [Alphaproteobacteria bacterium]